MTTLGDVKPSNNREAVLTSFVMIYGQLYYSYNLVLMQGILSNLQELKYGLEKRIQALERMAEQEQIPNKLHRQMLNYLVHSTESKFQVEIEERKKLVERLPENLKQEYLEQSSHTFFKKMPFFSILRSQSKKLLAEAFGQEISSPGQSLTHKREGLQTVCILRMGTVGMAFRKRGATFNGMVLDRLAVESDTHGDPILLNVFLFNRRQRINYSLVCETFCTVATLDFEQLWTSLRENELDYEQWRKYYDSDEALDDDWTTKQCGECREFHSMFNCPRLTYMPLRSIIFLKCSNGRSQPGLQLHHNQHDFARARTGYLRSVRSQKNKEAARSPLKFWRRVFAPLEKLLEIDSEKNYYYFNERSLFSQKKGKIKKGILRAVDDHFGFNESDAPTDFEHYYTSHNPGLLVKINLRKQKRSGSPSIPSISSI